MQVRVERVGAVMVLVMANPPVNALSEGVRSGLAEGLAAGLADPTVTAIVLRGEGRGFCAGADIAEFGKPRKGVRLGDLCLAIEASPKPVIAAIHGMALGGGMELALAAHYRVANEAAVLGLPEVNLGILPGAGGTQRLPRIVGAKEALQMMLTGMPITAREAAGLGLVDRVVTSGLTEAALAMASEVPTPRPTGERRRGLKNARDYLAAVAEARAGQGGNRLPAPARIVDCVEAALLFPLAQGLETEAAAFADLVETSEAAGLRHAFFAERRAMQLPAAVTATGLEPIASLAIWTMGDGVADLATQALGAGVRVVLADPDRGALVTAMEAIALRQEVEVEAGRMSPEARDADWARLVSSTSSEALEGVDLVLCTAAAPALPKVGGALCQAALGQAGQGAPAGLTVPQVQGGLAELGMAAGAEPLVLARLAALARRLKWRLVPVGPGGPVELGLRQALARAMDFLADEGISDLAATAALARWVQPKPGSLPVPAATLAQQSRVIAVCLDALAAEGARMLQDGRARRPLEVDAISIMSGIVPRWEGGPMFKADQRGLLVLRRDLIALAEASPVFLPPELMDDLIAEGLTFASLNTVGG